MEYPDALNLLAGIVEQARKDLIRVPIHNCTLPYRHSPIGCANVLLSTIDEKVNHSPRRMTIEEIASTVLEVIE